MGHRKNNNGRDPAKSSREQLTYSTIHQEHHEEQKTVFERLFRPNRRQERSKYWVSEYRFKQNLIDIIVRVTIVVTPLIGIGYLAAYFMVEQVWSTLILGLGLIFMTPVSILALSLANRGGLRIAAQLYMMYMLVLGALLTLFLNDSLILIGILALTLNSILALFIEDFNIALRWIGTMMLTYWLMIALRLTGNYPPVVLGFVEPIFLFVAPIALVATILLLGNSTTNYLRSTLKDSEKLRKEVELSYKEAQRAIVIAQEANQLKSEFLSTMSHELRTPLNAIIGFSEIMTSGMGGAVDPEAGTMLDRVLTNARHLLSLINDILDISKIEARKLEVEHVEFSPTKLFTTIYEQMSSLAEKKALDFKAEVADNLPPVLVSDSDVLRQVVINLLSNAIKFTDKGMVRLRAQLAEDDMWHISVMDTGSGIPPHALDFIFEPFRQVDGTSTREHGGTGLGLAIVREYARELGGSVTVESELGEGSTFTLKLPLITSLDEVKEPA